MAGRALVAALGLAVSGCAAGGAGPPTEAAAKALASEIAQRNVSIVDATLAGKFILESDKGSAKGSVRIRYIRPDIYRVDVIASGVGGAGGGSSCLIEGDSSLVCLSPGGGTDAASLDESRVVTFLEDFDLALEDLKALAVSGPYLDMLSLDAASCRGVRGGYVLEGHSPNGQLVAVWINKDKETVVKGTRRSEDGLPVVETKLSRFKQCEGVWQPTRRVIRHFGQEASLSVQYDRIVLNSGLERDDLIVRGAGS